MLRLLLIACTVCLIIFVFGCDNSTEPKVKVPTPTFNPQPGTFFSPQTVQITCQYPKAITIHYTLDNTDPTSSSATYTAPLPISGQTTIKAKGFRDKMIPSEIATGTFHFNVGTIYIYPLGGTFTAPQEVTISSVTEDVIIHYTTDGTEPNENSPVCDGSLLVDSNIVLKAKGFIDGWNPSETKSASFNFNTTQPTFNYNSGTYYNEFELTMSSPTENANIYYTTDGTDPTQSSNLYSAPLQINNTTTVKAMAIRQNWNPSPIVSNLYTLKVVAPAYNPNPGTYYTEQNITITTTTQGAELHYTTDGSDPTLESPLYAGPVLIDVTTALKAKGFKTGWSASNTTTGAYTIKVNAPAFNPPPGNYSTAQIVTIYSDTPDAEIHYTLNGATPTQSSALYTEPVSIPNSTVIKAIAYKQGLTTSVISVGNYVIANTVATPTFDPDPSVVYSDPIEVVLSCATPDAEIHYTLDHTPPSIITPQYTTYPIQINQTTEIRAIAYRSGMLPSSVAIAFYTIQRTVATPTFSPDPSVIYYTPQTVTIECTTTGADIYYTTDGSEPTESSNAYSDPLVIATSTEIKAKAFRDGWDPSATATAQYQVESNNQIFAWGVNDNGQCNVPIGSGFIQIDAGSGHTVALRSNGSLAAWGDNSHQQCNFPPGNNYVAVSAGGNHSLALKSDGTIVAWGENEDGQCDVPDTLGFTYQAISAGGAFSLALTSNNNIVAWGNNDDGQCNVPPDSIFTKVSAGTSFGLALTTSGGLIAWGNNDSGQLNAPADNGYNDIAAGDQHCVAKRTNNSLVAWGLNDDGQASVPAGSNFSLISAGHRHNVALRTDGSIVTWGYNGNGLGNVPAGNEYFDVSAGEDFSVCLKNMTRQTKANTKKKANSLLKF